MSENSTKALIDRIKTLSDKAAQASDSGDAMRFSQAANNVANAAVAVDSLLSVVKS